MKKASLLFVCFAALAVMFAGCSKKEEKGSKADDSKIAKYTVDQLAQHLTKGECTPVDANGVQTRAEFGKIPGATLLTNYKTFKPEELPQQKDAKLVFYCSNEQCGASHAAAEKAIVAGYSDVGILPAGVAGWKKAGQKTEPVAVQ